MGVHHYKKNCILIEKVPPTASQHYIDQVYNKLSAIKRTANCQGRRGADSTDCLIFGKGVQHQIVIHSLEMKMDSLAVGLSSVFNVTDRWVITVSQSWQAVEMKKWRCGTRGWIRGEDRGWQWGGRRRLSASCYGWVKEKMKRKWILCLQILFHIPAKNISCQTSHWPESLHLEPAMLYCKPWTAGCYFVGVTSHVLENSNQQVFSFWMSQFYFHLKKTSNFTPEQNVPPFDLPPSFDQGRSEPWTPLDVCRKRYLHHI